FPGTLSLTASHREVSSAIGRKAMTAAVTEISSATELNHTGARSSSHGVGIESVLDAAKDYSTCLIRTTHITQLCPDLFRRSRERARAVVRDSEASRAARRTWGEAPGPARRAARPAARRPALHPAYHLWLRRLTIL